MNFLKLLKEKFYILEESGLFNIQASLYFGHDKKLIISILRNLTDEQYRKIIDARNSKTRKAPYIYATKVTSDKPSDVDKNLYVFKYRLNKDKDTYSAALLYIDESNYSKINSTLKQKKILEDLYDIKEASVEDVINLFLDKPLSSDIDKVKYVKTVDEIIEKLSMVTAREKQKETDKNKPKKELSLTKRDDNPEELKKEDIVGADFFYRDVVKPVYDKLLNYHLQLKITTKSPADREKDEENREKFLTRFDKLIREYIDNSAESNILQSNDIAPDNVKKLLFNHLKNKLGQYKSLYDKIESKYLGKESEPSDDEKEVPKKKRGSREKTEVYYIQFFDETGELVEKKEKFTEKEAQEVAAKARENYKEYKQDKKDFEKWDLDQSPGKTPYSFTDKMKNPTKYGILSISKTKSKVLEMSATGGGAAPGTGASVSSGEGEGVAAKYAFAKNPKIVKKEFEFKNEAKMIFLESLRGLFKNK